MEPLCQKQMSFKSLLSKKVVADFQGGVLSSDGGGLLFRELDVQYGLSKEIARCLSDERDSSRVVHELITLVRQRLFAIAMGYEDTNDAETLRRDPVLKILSGLLPEGSGDLASQPTLCRFENRIRVRDLRRLSDALCALYVRVHPGPRDVVVIDLDSTDDPTHGHQQLSLFHGYYEQRIYHPLLAFDGVSGFPLAAVLRPGNAHAGRGAVAVLKRLVKKLRKAYPGVRIVLRADAGFAVPAIYRFCERHHIHYVIGLITNDRLRQKVEALAAGAEAQYHDSREKQRLFTAFGYRAKSWRRSRRVVAKVEHLPKGPNQRFVVTDLHLSPQRLYDEIYVLRGDVENRIKELKVELKADRLSCHRFLANQFRLLLHTFAYTLFLLLRRHLEGTELAAAQVGTLRLKVLKIGARIRETAHRIWIHMASGYPYQALWTKLLIDIRTAPT